MNETSSTGNGPAASKRVECRAAKDPAVRLFIIAAMLIGVGLWCLTDWRERPEAWDARHINEVSGYLLNNWGPFLFLPGGLVVVYWAIRFLRRVLIADGEGVGYAGKDRISWDKIEKVDATELPQGFLRIEHDGGEVLTLDSWKLQNFRDLVAFLETRVPKDRQVTAATKAE